MQIKARWFLFILLAMSFSFELHGQSAPKKPLVLETQVLNGEFLNGQNIEIKFGISFKSNVEYALDGLTNVGENFKLIDISSTDPVPIGNDKEYSATFVTLLIEPKNDLPYGKYELADLFVEYHFLEMSWEKDKKDNETLKAQTNVQKEKVPTIVLVKVPLTASLQDNEGMQEVINISEHSVLKLVILKEKNIEILNYLPLAERKKLGLVEATDLDKPVLAPFSLVNSKLDKKDRGQYEELEYKYTLALYDINLLKMFELPAIKVFYVQNKEGTERKIRSFETPVIKVRTNSVLLEDTNFKPPKDLLGKMDSTQLYLYGDLPLAIAKWLSILAGAIFAWAFLRLLLKILIKARKTGPLSLIKEIRGKLSTAINRLEFISRRRMFRAFQELSERPENATLRVFIKAARNHVGNKVKLDSVLAQSMTSAELLAKLKQKYNIDNISALEMAEYLLDESEISKQDTDEVGKQMLRMEKAIKI